MNPRSLAFAVGCTLALALAACSGGSSAPKPTSTPPTPGPVDVIAQWVHDNRNVDFVGECSAAKQGVDIGKLCVSVAGQRGTLRAYNLGPTFSGPTALAMLQEKDGVWKVLSVTNRDPGAGDVPGIAWPLEVGDQIVVVGLAENDCLNVRETPSTKGKPVACVPQGTKAIIQDGPQQGENYNWWKVSGDFEGGGGFAGWAADRWMRLPEAIAQALQPQPTATPGG